MQSAKLPAVRRPARKHEHFVRDFIPKVSRTFALAIKFLPVGLRHPVFTAYLLCRVADTIEDSPQIEPSERKARLLYLKKLLTDGCAGRRLDDSSISPLFSSIDRGQGHDHRLLASSSKLFEILGQLPSEEQGVIYHWAGEMAGGMAEFSQLAGSEPGGRIAALRDSVEWDRYCYYVAGTVGQMLTELFIIHYGIESSTAAEMKRLGSSFGLGLQKVNVIKDVPDDRQRGVCFLPVDILTKHELTPDSLDDASKGRQIETLVRELADMSMAHLDDAVAYTTLLSGRYRGVRMFLTVPVFLAVETLNLVKKNPIRAMTGPPIKITRKDVARLVAAARMHSSSNDRLTSYYQRLKRKGMVFVG